MESGYQDSSFRIAVSKKFLKFLGNLFEQSPFLRNSSWAFFWEFNETESSHRRCSISKALLENFTKFTGEHLCWSLFFNKAGSLSPLTLLKKRLTHSFFCDKKNKIPPDDCYKVKHEIQEGKSCHSEVFHKKLVLKI